MNEHTTPPNSMKQFAILIGEWDMVGIHPALPEPVRGHSSFSWLKEETLLRWHFDWERGGIPTALSIIGHDDSVEACSVLYSDERGICRIYQMSLSGGVWKMWRDVPGFSQRMTATFSEDENTITWHGELSLNGSTWEQDLDMTYTRKL